MSTVPFRNVSGHSIDLSIAATIAGVTVSPPSATLAAGDELDVQLLVTAPVQSIPGVPAMGDVLVAVNGNQLLGRSLQLTTNGAVMTTSQQTLDFGESSVPASPLVRTFTVVNTGNEDGELMPNEPAAPYSLTSTGSVDIAGGTSQAVGVAFQPLDGSFDASLALSFSSNTCQPPPTSIALSGVGTGDAILVDHLVLDFGTATCGAAAATLPLTFTNNAATAQPLTFTVSGPGQSLFTAPVAPTLAPGPSMMTMMVTRNPLEPPLPVGNSSATLAIMAPALTTPTLVTLDQLISAPQLSLDASTITFNMVPEETNRQQNVQVTNSGNAVANVTVSQVLLASAVTVAVSPSSFQIPPGGMVTTTVSISTGNAVTSGSVVFELDAAGSCIAAPTLTVNYSVANGAGSGGSGGG